MHPGGLQPSKERAHRGEIVSRARARHGDLRSCLILVAIRPADHDYEPARGIKRQILDVQCDQLGAPQRGGEPEQQQRAVAPAGERRGESIGSSRRASGSSSSGAALRNGRGVRLF